MKKYTVEMKINKDYYNEPDYDVWDSDVYLVEVDTADEAIDLAMDDYRDSMADDTMENIENIECEKDTIYYTENGIPCRVLFKAIERQV